MAESSEEMLLSFPFGQYRQYAAGEPLLEVLLASPDEFGDNLKFDFGEFEPDTFLEAHGCLCFVISWWLLPIGKYRYSGDLSTVCLNNKFSTVWFLQGRIGARHLTPQPDLVLVHLLHLLR